MPKTELNGLDMAYGDTGGAADAPALLLVHGHPFNRTMWHPQEHAFSAAGWRVLTPDLRGYGESLDNSTKVTLDMFARDLAALLDKMNIERPVICGLSMGGQIAMEFCRLFPDRVRGVILAATFPRAETEDGKAERARTASRLLKEGMESYSKELLPKMLGAKTIRHNERIVAHVLEMMRTTRPEGAAAAILGRAERPSYEPTLAKLRVPALIVVGDQDFYTTRDDALRMNELIENSRLQWIKETGHMPNLEEIDEFNSAVLEFLGEFAAQKGFHPS